LGEPRLHTKGPHARKEGICQIGILGDPDRPDDIETIESALRRVVIKLETRIQLEVVGTFEHGRASVGKRVGYPKLNDYPRLVDWLFSRVNWDIIIVPEGFASAGEDMIRVRLMEIGALGAAMLCPRKIGEAIPFLNEDNCRLYASPSQLESQIGELAAQPERRQKLEFNLRKAVSLTTEEDRYGEKLLEILGHNG
jgi:hypothetical protein